MWFKPLLVFRFWMLIMAIDLKVLQVEQLPETLYNLFQCEKFKVSAYSISLILNLISYILFVSFSSVKLLQVLFGYCIRLCPNKRLSILNSTKFSSHSIIYQLDCVFIRRTDFCCSSTFGRAAWSVFELHAIQRYQTTQFTCLIKFKYLNLDSYKDMSLCNQ